MIVENSRMIKIQLVRISSPDTSIYGSLGFPVEVSGFEGIKTAIPEKPHLSDDHNRFVFALPLLKTGI